MKKIVRKHVFDNGQIIQQNKVSFSGSQLSDVIQEKAGH